MHPDFVFFHEIDGDIKASIVDPHGLHLDDAEIKLKALASFASTYKGCFHRIEALAEIDGQMKVIDMQLSDVRETVLASREPAVQMYRSPIAVNYNPILDQGSLL
jgi:hypothetical protein